MKTLFSFSLLLALVALQMTCGSNTYATKSYSIDDSIPLCLFFPQISNQKIAFLGKVDKFQALEADTIYSHLRTNYQSNTTSVIFYAPGNYQTRLNYYIDEKVINLMSIVIEMDNGRVSSIFWDTGCHLCKESECFSVQKDSSQSVQMCGVSSCTVTSVASSECDLKVYVTYRGTDNSGNELTSDNLRLSNFREYSVYSLYTSAKNSF